jgi:alpha-tubulin suppressor-like RCC1 family protein
MPSIFVTRRAAPVMLALAGAVASATVGFAAGAAAAPQARAATAASTATSLVAWGANSGGQLGNGSTTAATSPVTVSLPSGTTVTGEAVGANHALAVTGTGTVLAWGTNSSGQLGNGSTTSTTTPVAVSLPSGTTVTEVSAGNGFSLALTSAGQVLAWGANGSGQLGDGTGTTRTTPVPVHLPSGTTVTEISAGASFALARTSAGQVLAWGGNRDGELGNLSGNGSSTPVAVTLPALPSGVTASDVAAGGNFGLVRTSDGEVFAFGAGASGQLGDGATTSSAPVAVQLPSGSQATAISAGAATGYALTGSGALAWGAGTAGQLGNGLSANSDTPVTVSLPSGETPVSLAGGSQGAVVSTHDGSLFTWGTGALGAGAMLTGSNTPVSPPVPSGDSAFGVASGPAATADLAVIGPTPPPFMEPVVPDLTGLTPDDAQTSLADVGLTLGTVGTTPTSNCDLLGEVVRQVPLAGKSEPPGTAVNIFTGTEIKNMCG